MIYSVHDLQCSHSVNVQVYCALASTRVLAQPANDNLCSATTVSEEEGFPVDNFLATLEAGEDLLDLVPVGTLDTFYNTTCTSEDGWCQGENTIEASIWFRFSAFHHSTTVEC